MAKQDSNQLEKTRRLMQALVRMPPKPHEEMKMGKKNPKKKAAKRPSKP